MEKTAATMLKEEISNIVERYGQESDVTVYETIGALEVVKLNLLERLGKLPPQE